MAGTRVQTPEGFVICGPKTRARPRTGSGLSHPRQDQAAAQANTDSSATRLPIGRETSALQYWILTSLSHARLAKAKMAADRAERGIVPDHRPVCFCR